MNSAIITTELALLSWSQASGAWAESLAPRAMPRPQPSLRIPVIPANREHLRRLRAAESDAWETSVPRPAGRRQPGKGILAFSGAAFRPLADSAAGTV